MKNADYLKPTYFVDADAPAVRAFAERAVAGATGERERAVRLYYAVRDEIRYDPYVFPPDREGFRASAVARAEAAFCIPKATLLAACARAVGIPARLGYADVRNHLTSEKLKQRMNGVDVFVFHGYTELFVEGAWRKVTPTFNRELCERFRVKPLDWDGRGDALFHEFDADGRRHMEYVHDRGTYADLPYDEMRRLLRETYGEGFGGGADTTDEAFGHGA